MKKNSLKTILLLAIVIFLLVRLILNIGDSPLSILFLASYATLLLILWRWKKIFIFPYILFLTADSIIGTYLHFTGRAMTEPEYWGTMIINAVFVILGLWLDRIIRK